MANQKPRERNGPAAEMAKAILLLCERTIIQGGRGFD